MSTHRWINHIGLRLALLTITLSTWFVVGSVSARGAEIVRISFTTSDDGEGQIIRLHSASPLQIDGVEVHQEQLSEAFILIPGADLAPSLVRGRAVDPIRSYRIGASSGQVRLDLTLDDYRPVRIIAYPDRDSNDLLISVHYASVRWTAGTTPVSFQPVSSLAATDADERWNLDCVVVDAGHGGEDLGAVANGLKEKDINLSVAKLLGSLVEEELGLRVIYTRKTDEFISLQDRGRIANERCGKLFISLHVNSAPSRAASGTEIYFLGLHKTDAAKRVMERENSVIRLEENQDQYAEFGDDQYILQTLAQSVYLRESEALASFVDSQFTGMAGREGRGVKQAGFLVLWKASMPAILVELGFITNRKESVFLNSPDGQNVLARALLRSIKSYRDLYQKGYEPTLAE